MDWIISRYAKYNIRYNCFSHIVIIESKIPVKDFIRLRKEIKSLNIYVKDIIVIG